MKYLLPFICLALIVASCGESDDGDQPDDSDEAHAEDALAETALLTIDDFPNGWAEEPDDDEDDDSLEECDTGPAPGRTGIAESGDFSEGGAASIQHTVAVFSDEESANAALDVVEAIADCVVEKVEDGKLDDEETKFTEASFSRLSFEDVGEASRAYRFKIRAESKEDDGPFSEVDVYLDMVYVQTGRITFSILAGDVLSPYDTTELTEVVDKALVKAEDALRSAE